MFSTVSVNSEEFIFYIDLTKDYVKKKNIIKAISNFAKEREKFNSTTSYGILMFQQNENLLTSYDRKDPDIIINILGDKWDEREVEHSFLENGLFELLAYVFRKSREDRKNYRIIVISDTPSGLPETYHHTLYDLLLKAKNFNTFIDVIRIGQEKFYEDDVKLKVITSETGGGVFYSSDDPKIFSNILHSLIQSKTELSVVRLEEDQDSLKEDKLFYEKLAVDLISLDSEDAELCDICEQELCPICEAHSDEIHKCFNCAAKYHSCCAAKYALMNNIGIKHLFRCVKCDTLLKLDEEFVDLIYQEEFEEDEIEFDNIEEQVDVIEEEIEIPIEKDHEIITEKETQEKEYTTKKVRIGGFFGQEIEISRQNNRIEPEKHLAGSNQGSEVGEEPELEKKISITALKPPKKKTIKLCKICGTTLRSTHTCPLCGARVD